MFLLWGGIVGALLFLTVFTVDGATRPGYRPRRHPVSALALGSRGWVQVANFVVCGALILGGAVGAWLALLAGDRGWLGWLVSLLLAVFAVGLVLSGVFSMDPMRDYPPAESSEPSGSTDESAGSDTIDDSSVTGAEAGTGPMPVEPTRTHRIHDQLGGVVFLAMPALAFTGAALLFDGGRGLIWSGLGVLAGIAQLVLLGRFEREWEADGDHIGLVQRVMLMIGLGWIVLLLANFL